VGVLVASLCFVLVVVVILTLLHLTGRRERVMTPILLFVGIEVAAVWLPLLPTESSVMAEAGPFPALLAAVSLLLAVVAYVLLGGQGAPATNWRAAVSSPNSSELRSLRIGLTLLVGMLTGLAVYRFGGLPPMLTGGISSLLDPVMNAEQATLIRETRRSLTKGQLIGEAYSGQGIFNAASEVGWQISVAGAVLYWSWARTRGSAWGLAVVAVLAFAILGSAGARAPLLFCGIAAAAALALRFRPTTRQLVAAGCVAAVLALLIMPLSKGAAAGVSVTERASALVERISNGNGRNNAEIVRLIDIGSLDIAEGELFVERAEAMIPGISPTDPFALRVTRLAYGSTERTTGYSTPTQFGLLYADGGPLVVLLGYMLSGGLLAVLWRQIARLRSPAGALVAVQGSILLGYLSVTGIHGLIANGAVAALLVLVAAGPAGWSRLSRTLLRRAEATSPAA